MSLGLDALNILYPEEEEVDPRLPNYLCVECDKNVVEDEDMICLPCSEKDVILKFNPPEEPKSMEDLLYPPMEPTSVQKLTNYELMLQLAILFQKNKGRKALIENSPEFLEFKKRDGHFCTIMGNVVILEIETERVSFDLK